MKIVMPSATVVFHVPEGFESIEAFIESVGRTCYKSEDRITGESAERFVTMLRGRGHHAMLEHCVASARIICDRGASHELVRHRIASYAQESTRFCNYSKDKFDNQISVVKPPGMTADQEKVWWSAMEDAEAAYLNLIANGTRPEIARSVLPIGLKTEIIITANLREWMHIFELRCAPAAHPIIRGIMQDLLRVFYRRIPSMFDDLQRKYNNE
jgi:thymidylate synthase (FAD)